MTDIHTRLASFIDELRIIDTHEHLPPFESDRRRDVDILGEYLSHYFSSDLVSAGLSPEALHRARDASVPIIERWSTLEPYWEMCRHTGYGRSLDTVAQDLYGIGPISRKTIEPLNAAFLESRERSGWFKEVLSERSRIDVSILDSHLVYDRSLFRSAWRLDRFVLPTSGEVVAEIERDTGVAITGFDSWLEACRVDFHRALDAGVVALKCGLAYHRTLRFPRTTRSAAEADFNDLMAHKVIGRWSWQRFSVGEHLQNYMMHVLLALADQHQVVYQIHTGIQEGNGNILTHSDPTHLIDLFVAYPNITFDVFHMGYPYQHTLSAVAKNFPHVFVNMCWAHIISPPASMRALQEWLEVLPWNKILGFGGDYLFIDGVYGHQRIARDNVTRALSGLVEQGRLGLPEAEFAAECVLSSNARRLYGLGS